MNPLRPRKSRLVLAANQRGIPGGPLPEEETQVEERNSYAFSAVLNCSYEMAISKVTDALKEEGFGVLTEIDVQATLKKS